MPSAPVCPGAWFEQAQQGTLALPHLHAEVSADEWLNQLVGFVLHDGRIAGDARSLLMRLAEILYLPEYDVALVARKLAHRKWLRQEEVAKIARRLKGRS